MTIEFHTLPRASVTAFHLERETFPDLTFFCATNMGEEEYRVGDLSTLLGFNDNQTTSALFER